MSKTYRYGTKYRLDRGEALYPIYGTKEEVWAERAQQTRGGLRKKDLMLNRKGKVVSRKQHAAGEAAIKRLVKDLDRMYPRYCEQEELPKILARDPRHCTVEICDSARKREDMSDVYDEFLSLYEPDPQEEAEYDPIEEMYALMEAPAAPAKKTRKRGKKGSKGAGGAYAKLAQAARGF